MQCTPAERAERHAIQRIRGACFFNRPNPKLGSLAPISVVNVVFTAGDANLRVQTAAFNLPNGERVVKEKGTKRVMLKNVQDAKFNLVVRQAAAS